MRAFPHVNQKRAARRDRYFRYFFVFPNFLGVQLEASKHEKNCERSEMVLIHAVRYGERIPRRLIFLSLSLLPSSSRIQFAAGENDRG